MITHNSLKMFWETMVVVGHCLGFLIPRYENCKWLELNLIHCR